MAGTDEEDDLLKSSDSEDDTLTLVDVKDMENIKEKTLLEAETKSPACPTDSTQDSAKDPKNKLDTSNSVTRPTMNNHENDDLSAEIDDFLNELEKEPEADSIVSAKEDSSISSSAINANGNHVLDKKTIEKPSKDEQVERASKPKESSHIKPSANSPLAQSTPIRALNTNASENKESPLPPAEPELDFSLLDDDDDDEPTFINYTLTELMGEIDFSILDDEDEESENEENTLQNQTVIEKKQDVSNNNGATIASTDAIEKKTEDVSKVKKVGVAKPISQQAFTKSIQQIMREYYEKARKDWENDMKIAKVQFPIPPIRFLKEPNSRKDSRTKKFIAIEKYDEWKDNYHPMWAEYRTCNRERWPALISEKWGKDKTIDISRNLTKFSNRLGLKSAAVTKNKAGSKSKSNTKQLPETCNEIKELEPTEILNLMLESVRSKENDENEIDSGPAVPTSTSTNSLAGCKYCTFRCHCSPGRRLKRPYSEIYPPVIDTDLKSQPKLLKLGDVEEEIRNYKTTRMNNEEPEDRLQNDTNAVINTYMNQAGEVMNSSKEIFELGTYFNKEENNFSREQVRELLSVENTQDTFRQVYKSPYGGEGYSDEEDSSDTDSEIGSVEDKNDNEWTQGQIEDY